MVLIMTKMVRLMVRTLAASRLRANVRIIPKLLVKTVGTMTEMAWPMRRIQGVTMPRITQRMAGVWHVRLRSITPRRSPTLRRSFGLSELSSMSWWTLS
jgi:hypothetical protein